MKEAGNQVCRLKFLVATRRFFRQNLQGV